MTPISKRIGGHILTKYDEPYQIGCKLSEEKPCNALYPILLPGLPEQLAKGFLFMDANISNYLKKALQIEHVRKQIKQHDTSI